MLMADIGGVWKPLQHRCLVVVDPWWWWSGVDSRPWTKRTHMSVQYVKSWRHDRKTTSHTMIVICFRAFVTIADTKSDAVQMFLKKVYIHIVITGYFTDFFVLHHTLNSVDPLFVFTDQYGCRK